MRGVGKVYLAVLAITLMLTLLANSPIILASNGPRTEDLIIYFYPNAEYAYYQLKVGNVDLLAEIGYSGGLPLHDGKLLDADFCYQAFADINDVLAPLAAINMYEFDLNNNYSIQEYPGIKSPMNYPEMRQVIAFLTNKTLIVNEFCAGFAERIDQMIPAPMKGWANESYSFPNYPYEYDPASAWEVLEFRFPEGTTPNPYYDPTNPLSAKYIRTYPEDHPQKPLQDLDPLIACVRADDVRRKLAWESVYRWLKLLGVPVTPIESLGYGLYDRVMGDFNYHLYTGSWTGRRFTCLDLYRLYHSINCFPYGANYVTGVNSHPKLDQYLDKANYAIYWGDAVQATKNAGGEMTIECVNVPLWSDISYCVYSTRLVGIVNVEGYGPVNPFTFMNAYRADGGPIRIGLVGAPFAVNTVYSNWMNDYICLDRLNLYSDVETPSYNIAADQPGFVKEYNVGTWDDDGMIKTMVTKKLRPDSYFAEPVTGNQKANVNASHYFFSAWYDHQIGNGWFSPSYKDLHHIVITDTHTVEIYFDTSSYFNIYYANGPLRPIDTWAQHPELVTKHSETFVEGINLTTPGYVDLAYNPVWIESVTGLTIFSGYNIVRGKLYVYADLAPGTMIIVRYWAPGDPRGYTPGNLAWQTVFEGAGMYYCTDYNEVSYAVFKRNPYYYMETPLLGEVDFVRKPDGAYKIDIYDLAIAGGAYGSQGTGVPSSNWFPGADIAPTHNVGGTVDPQDLVTIIFNWDQVWDIPPPDS